MTKPEKEVSFMNKYFIYKKIGNGEREKAESKDIEKKDVEKKLSSDSLDKEEDKMLHKKLDDLLQSSELEEIMTVIDTYEYNAFAAKTKKEAIDFIHTNFWSIEKMEGFIEKLNSVTRTQLVPSRQVAVAEEINTIDNPIDNKKVTKGLSKKTSKVSPKSKPVKPIEPSVITNQQIVPEKPKRATRKAKVKDS